MFSSQLAQRSKERAEALGQTRPELPSSPPTSLPRFFWHLFFTNISYFVSLPRDLTTSPASSYKPYLKFSVNAILARGEDGEEEEEERKPLLRRNEEKESLRSPSPSLSPQPPPYSSSSPPLSPIVTQVKIDGAKKVYLLFVSLFFLRKRWQIIFSWKI